MPKGKNCVGDGSSPLSSSHYSPTRGKIRNIYSHPPHSPVQAPSPSPPTTFFVGDANDDEYGDESCPIKYHNFPQHAEIDKIDRPPPISTDLRLNEDNTFSSDNAKHNYFDSSPVTPSSIAVPTQSFRKRIDSISLLRTNAGVNTIPDQMTSPVMLMLNQNNRVHPNPTSGTSSPSPSDDTGMKRVDSISLLRTLNKLNTADPEENSDSPRSLRVLELNSRKGRRDGGQKMTTTTTTTTTTFDYNDDIRYLPTPTNAPTGYGLKRRDSLDVLNLYSGTNTICTQNVESPRWKKIALINRERAKRGQERRKEEKFRKGLAVEEIVVDGRREEGKGEDDLHREEKNDGGSWEEKEEEEKDSGRDMYGGNKLAASLLRGTGNSINNDDDDSPRLQKIKTKR